MLLSELHIPCFPGVCRLRPLFPRKIRNNSCLIRIYRTVADLKGPQNQTPQANDMENRPPRSDSPYHRQSGYNKPAKGKHMAGFERASGVLLHPTALPGRHGIGTLGVQATAFLDWLKTGRQRFWQICPLVPTGYGDSPYQGFSAFAGNPNLIDLDDLVSLGFLDPEDLSPLETLPAGYVDFGRLIPMKSHILRKAWIRCSSGSRKHADFNEDMRKFRKEAANWLEDYALFMVLKEKNSGRPWCDWEHPLRFRETESLDIVRSAEENALGYHVFVQYLFHRQWTKLKAAAGERGLSIIGDLPIFIAYDSSDCWAHPELFQLDADRRPTHVAGVPPDYFSRTGQLWGNPLYDWETMEQNGFAWWIEVLRSRLRHYDVLRIDHFRGFSAYWSVPFGEKTAENGEWIPAPGSALFARLRQVLGTLPIIAEDLGVITDDVVELIQECGFPGMKVLQFAFDSSEENDYLPHNYEKHCLVYTGTHDNDTAAGWYTKAPEKDRSFASKYLNLPVSADGRDAARAMVRTALASVAVLAISPLQDILGLGSYARFNTPGTLGSGNWTWRTSETSFGPELAAELAELTETYGR